MHNSISFIPYTFHGKCYRAQACSAHYTAGQRLRKMRCWGKEETYLSGESGDREDGRLAPQNNHLIGVWMSRSFYQSERKKQWGTKTKGIIEREMQWGTKVKGSSVLQNISKGMANLQKECVNLFYSHVGRDKLSLHQLDKGTLAYSQAEGQRLPGKSLSEYHYKNKSKSKEQFPTCS